jgi:hypothetical protein
MYFSEIYSIFFLDSFFHFLYLFKMWEIFVPHPVFVSLCSEGCLYLGSCVDCKSIYI